MLDLTEDRDGKERSVDPNGRIPDTVTKEKTEWTL